MPELPDIVVYVERLAALVLGAVVERVEVRSPFVLRSVTPPISAVEGRRVVGVRRIGKRIVIAVDDELFVVLHLMIAGRLRWRPRGQGAPGKRTIAALVFSHGTLFLTEAGSTRRASLHLVRGEAGLRTFDRGGLEVLASDLADFSSRLTSESHTLKRALTDPHLFSGIGNAHSDEILHRARLSPLALTTRLTEEEIARLFAAAQATLNDWTARLRAQTGDLFPETVTAFREGMAVHGRFGQACPVCEAPVQRIRYAANETNYCARCQTGGRLLADRALSRLLKKDWPKSLDDGE